MKRPETVDLVDGQGPRYGVWIRDLTTNNRTTRVQTVAPCRRTAVSTHRGKLPTERHVTMVLTSMGMKRKSKAPQLARRHSLEMFSEVSQIPPVALIRR